MSQATFAQIFNLARPSVGAYEEGRAEPRIDTVVQIAQYFGISVDALLTRDLTVNELYRFDSLKGKKTLPETTDSEKDSPQPASNTFLVTIDKQPEYVRDHKKSDFIDSLPRFHFPGIRGTHARAFEMEGESMSFDQKGILPGDVIVCEKRMPPADALQHGRLYVLITSGKIYIRRYKSGDKKLIFICDNPDWPAEEYKSRELFEIWQAEGIYTRSLNPRFMMKDRIEELEDRYLKLAERIETLEGKKKG